MLSGVLGLMASIQQETQGQVIEYEEHFDNGAGIANYPDWEIGSANPGGAGTITQVIGEKVANIVDPGDSDAIRSINLICEKMAEAVIEGKMKCIEEGLDTIEVLPEMARKMMAEAAEEEVRHAEKTGQAGADDFQAPAEQSEAAGPAASGRAQGVRTRGRSDAGSARSSSLGVTSRL
jgi:hypothetical protein